MLSEYKQHIANLYREYEKNVKKINLKEYEIEDYSNVVDFEDIKLLLIDVTQKVINYIKLKNRLILKELSVYEKIVSDIEKGI